MAIIPSSSIWTSVLPTPTPASLPFDLPLHLHLLPSSPLSPPFQLPSRAPRHLPLNFSNSNASTMMMMMMMMCKLAPPYMQKREKEHLRRVSVVTQAVYLPVFLSDCPVVLHVFHFYS